MKLKAVVLALTGCILVAGFSLAMENMGADQIELNGGTRGQVPFPHHQHQNVLVDCNVCHGVFPQEKGAIDRLKAEGKLQKKEVMNKLCTSCHKEKKKAGEKTGPVTCKQCHIRAM